LSEALVTSSSKKPASNFLRELLGWLLMSKLPIRYGFLNRISTPFNEHYRQETHFQRRLNHSADGSLAIVSVVAQGKIFDAIYKLITLNV
jgi:hypothetical protein